MRWLCAWSGCRPAAPHSGYRPAQNLTLLLCQLRSGLSVLYQKIPTDLGDSCTQHLPNWPDQVQSAKLQDDAFDAARGKELDRAADAMRIPAKPVQPGHQQRLAVADLAEQPGELLALLSHDLPGHTFICQQVIHLVPDLPDLEPLILDGLLFRADPVVSR
jgi:hypothetical protein